MRWMLLVLLFPLGLAAQAPDFTSLVREAGAAVVNVGAAYATPPVLPDLPHDDALGELLERLAAGQAPDFEAPPLGSGFIVRSDGYIVTSYHIVQDAFNDEVVVRLADGREFLGKVLGMDRYTDIALVKLDAAGLPQARIGDPRRLQAGEWVATIGSPFGLERSLAAGVVSALDRAIPAEGQIGFIQSDLAINPGNSGGPLFNLRGEVVGVNSLIFSNTGGSIGLSFAIPIDVVMKVAEQLRLHGKVTRGRIGVRLQAVTPELAAAFGLPRAAGALVTQTEKRGPAERAGLRAGDVVIAFNGKPVQRHGELLDLASDTAPGALVAVDVLRAGLPSRLSLRIAEAWSGPPRLMDSGGTDRLGFRVAALTDAQRKRLAPEGGVLVQRAEGAARRAGLYPGDVIVSVNARSTRTPKAFAAAVGKAPPGDAVALLVARAGSRAFVPLRIP